MNSLQFYTAKTLTMLSLIFYSLFFWSQIVKMLQNKNLSIGLSGVMGSICDHLQENQAQRGTLRKNFFCTYRVVGVQILSSPSFIVVA